jgi:hypothetical protein
LPGAFDGAQVVTSQADAVDDVPLVFGHRPELLPHVGNDRLHSRVSVVHLEKKEFVLKG